MKYVALKVRQDNLMYLLYDDNNAIAFDVFDPITIEMALSSTFHKPIMLSSELSSTCTPRKLLCVFTTHHHFDHNSGNNYLKNKGYTIYDGTNLKDGDVINGVEVISTPCHTLDSFCFKIDNYLITGDTFFFLGCGKFFEGNSKLMDQAIKKVRIRVSPDVLMLYGHDYSETNIKFTETFYKLPSNIKKKKFLTLGEEILYNPFINWKKVQTLGFCKDLEDLRNKKNKFKL